MAAGFLVHDGSADRTVTTFKMIDAGSVDRTITQGRVIGPDGVDRVFWDPSGTVSFSVSLSRAFVTGVDSSGSGVATTVSVTATATGGTGPYTYAWSTVGYSNSSAPDINSPVAATTTFTQTNMTPHSSDNATFTVVATDSSTPANHASADIPATWTEV